MMRGSGGHMMEEDTIVLMDPVFPVNILTDYELELAKKLPIY